MYYKYHIPEKETKLFSKSLKIILLTSLDPRCVYEKPELFRSSSQSDYEIINVFFNFIGSLQSGPEGQESKELLP